MLAILKIYKDNSSRLSMKIEQFKELKLSERIDLVLNDIFLCEKDPNVIFDMDQWCLKHDNICYVCIAGALICKTFPDFVGTCDNPLKRGIPSEIMAFNALRMGDVKGFLEKSKVQLSPLDKYTISYGLRTIYHSLESTAMLAGTGLLRGFSKKTQPYFKHMLRQCSKYLRQKGH